MKSRIIILSLFFILLSIPHSFPAEIKSSKNVLILFALSPSTPAYQVISDGIRSNLTNAYGDAVNLHMEYLEIERYPDQIYPCGKFELINQKYDKIDVQLLILVGVDIIRNVKKCASEKVLDLPAITVDYNLADVGIPLDLKLNDKNAIIGIKPNILGTIKSAVNLFPDRHHLYVISGTSNTDLMYLRIATEMIPLLDQNIKPTFINDISMDDALSLVRNLPDSSLIFIPGFNTDSKKVFYYNPEAIRLISQAANAPVFTISDMGFGDGALGGYILNFKKTGLLAGELAVKILNGMDPSSVNVVERDYYDQLYDWRELKRWNLAGSKLVPGGSKIEYEEKNFFKEYRWFIAAGILFLFLQSLLILNLVRLNRKQRLVTLRLIETENKFRELVNEDRLLRLSQLTASLSHELYQPLTAILSTAQAGLRFVDSGNLQPEQMKELFGNIVEDDKRTAAILSSIRGMMKLEKRDKEKIDLNQLLDEILNIYHSELIRNHIELDKILVEESVCIIADGVQIRQVIMNLVTNAIQSLDRKNKKTRKIIIREEVRDGEVTVHISDTGEGIPDEMMDKIFKPFITTKNIGTGIGLAISHTIIEDHQGRIWALNNPGGGATFAFSLKTC